jgi:hypothetical protein
MLRRNVPIMSGKMIAILHVPVSEEVGYMYLIMTKSFGKSDCWNGFMIFWNVSTRIQDNYKSTYDGGVGRLSGIVICE